LREVPRKPLRLDRRGGHDHFQLGPARQQAFEVAEEEVDVEAALVCFVDDDRVVRFEEPVSLRFREENAVGHHLDVRVRRELV
jgi:hypothetical protein